MSRQVWFMPLADERGVCKWDLLRTRAIPTRRYSDATANAKYRVTSAREVTCYPAFVSVCLSVCLSVSNFTQTLYWSHHENFTTGVSVDREELIKFWEVIRCWTRIWEFLKDSWILRDMAFLHSLAHIFRQSNRLFVKIVSQMFLWTRKCLINFGSHPDHEFGSGPQQAHARFRDSGKDQIGQGQAERHITDLQRLEIYGYWDPITWEEAVVVRW